METIASVLAGAGAILAEAGCEEPRRRARQLVAGGLGLTASELLMGSEKALAGSDAERLYEWARRFAGGEPLSRVLGRREFWGLEFELSPATFDPRPDSETVVEAVLARAAPSAALTILDLGTGSGCLLLALLSALKRAYGVGVDCSLGAAAVARGNARSLGLADRSCFIVGDWGRGIAKSFDVVISNPPYIATSDLDKLPLQVREYDPALALDGGVDGLAAYRIIAAELPVLLAPGAVFAAEVGAGQAAEIGAILRENGITIEAVERDLAGFERCIVARSRVA